MTRWLLAASMLMLAGCATKFYAEDGKTLVMSVPWPMEGVKSSNGSVYSAKAAAGTVDAATTVSVFLVAHSEPIAKYAIDRFTEKIQPSQ